ncbi:MAG TPA: tetratricopeptide repeat protein [Candidatus Hydrogenedens sp.]|nr:tetratricopeptide repeat protein [Candidatus Hydrogenedens sp.]HOK09476.1 tetratricopeptide repeat protein [Candidatus Hydrogenedens sp.]HOL20821.1 tetratricopeptide repeat protein [Candidatus Hydrogenedens sp.]HPP59185.1 tetratricopeptide repeat protein [Candidatus Hydrogenedens sp.]
MELKQDASTLKENNNIEMIINTFPTLFRLALLMALVILVGVLAVSTFYLSFGPPIVERLVDNAGENLMKFAQSLEQSRNMEDAKRIYELATKSRFAGEFNRTYVFYRLGYIYWSEQEYEKAVECLKQSVQSEYPQTGAYGLLIDSLLRLNKAQEALPFAEEWIENVKSKEMLADARFYLGKVHDMLNQPEEAEEAWIKGHKLLPGSKSSFELAFFYKKQGDCKNALYYAEACLKSGLLPTREPAIKKLIEQCKGK